MIDDVANDLKGDEGWCPFVYPDHLGYLTIGWGFMVDEKKGGRIPVPVAEFWLQYEITQRWAALCRRAPWLLEQPEEVQRAICNMAYQLGVDGVLGFKKTLRLLRAGDRPAAGIEALDSTWAREDTPLRARRVAARLAGIPIDQLPPTKERRR